ncbi:MAG TPA: DUF4173 domain-containing protein [Syntrophomonadaceae bacterium]|nr:DUF4173 domain-containing protein [Syntrophomonadaceae bacterium]
MNEHDLDINCSTLAIEPATLPTSGASARNEARVLRYVKEPFEADRKDGIFALFAFLLGFYFARWVLFSWEGWGVTAFTLVYCATVTLYLLKKRVHIPRAGWFWLTVVVLNGISYSFWANRGLEPWRSLLLLCSAIYWVICATGLPILGKTSNWIGLDGLNAMFVIPFSNFGTQHKSLAFLGRNKRTQASQIFSIVLGLVLTLIVAAIVLPLLLKADSGGFAKLTSGFLAYLRGMRLGDSLVHWILAIPIAAYLFGLVAGCAHKRGCNSFKVESTRKAFSVIRILPQATVYTLLGLLCSLYVLFIGSQLPYFFSAFIGQRPDGWLVYSEYARSGFFELCRIAAINLSVLLIANFFSKSAGRVNDTDILPGADCPKSESLSSSSTTKILKILNSLLAILTLILIATAMSKMVLYIGAYGLSMRRLLPCLFMVLLAVICGGVVALQKWQFSIARLAVGAGVAMLCALCLFDPDSFVARYNAERYLSGTLSNFDVAILYRSGPAGVDSALKVYAQTHDQVLHAELDNYLYTQKQEAWTFSGQHRDNLQKAHARQKITEYFL